MSYVKQYEASEMRLAAQHPPHGPPLARKDGFQVYNLSRLQQREYIATYLAAATYVDDQVGAVVDLVKRVGRQPTAFVVHADHGFHLGEHGRWSKCVPMRSLAASVARLPPSSSSTA
jgi:arylsulfatase A-like enzyme